MIHFLRLIAFSFLLQTNVIQAKFNTCIWALQGAGRVPLHNLVSIYLAKKNTKTKDAAKIMGMKVKDLNHFLKTGEIPSENDLKKILLFVGEHRLIEVPKIAEGLKTYRNSPSIAEWVRSRRIDAKLTPEELSSRLKIPLKEILKIENSSYLTPKKAILKKLDAYFATYKGKLTWDPRTTGILGNVEENTTVIRRLEDRTLSLKVTSTAKTGRTNPIDIIIQSDYEDVIDDKRRLRAYAILESGTSDIYNFESSPDNHKHQELALSFDGTLKEIVVILDDGTEMHYQYSHDDQKSKVFRKKTKHN